MDKLEHMSLIHVACNRHSIETVSLRKHVEFLRNIESDGFKIAQVNWIRISKSINLL